MKLPHLFVTLLLAALGPIAAVTAPAQSQPVRDKHAEAQLVSSHAPIAPGTPFTLGLKLTIDDTWHTYWINPGEAGKPTTLELDLPAGFQSGDLGFPPPKRFVIEYTPELRQAGYGYEDTVIHPVTITPPEDLEPGSSVTIDADVSWLMCDPSTCVPGKAELSITLPVAEMAQPSPQSDAIELYAEQLPEPANWPTEIALEGDTVTLTTRAPADALPSDGEFSVYAYDNGVFDPLTKIEATREGDTIIATGPKHESLEGAPDSFTALIVAGSDGGKESFRVSTAEGPAAAPAASTDREPNEADAASAGDDTTDETPADADGAAQQDIPFGGGLFGILFAAFLGGIILNIMPCVFPVISLKVMSFVGQSGEDRKKVFLHSAVFALGILVFFWILTTVLVVLRAAGSDDVGWGVQLRQPGFVLGLVFVMVVVALSLFGVFEIGGSMTSVGGDLANKSGYAGSFWSGALAVLLATPCTAPFMAPAIGFAIGQPPPIMYLVFSVLGLGLAAPYFVFAIFPKLLDLIPSPGPWMETFKQFMGFPMLAVAVWLIGVLSKQLSVGGLQWALAAVLFLAFAGWVLGRFCGFDRSAAVRRRGRVAAALIVIASLFVGYQASGKRAPTSSSDIREVIAEHRSEGRHVFVDFTAEWCLTCKVNERTTLKTNGVQEMFEENGVEFVIADWTNEDPSITSLLKEFGRAGVPFYALYPADPSKEPITLGDGLITAGDIEAAIEKLPK